MKTKVFVLSMIAALVSFLGFIVENIWLWLAKGYIDNRSMTFPFLVGYGLAMIAIYLLFGTPNDLRLLHKRMNVQSRAWKVLIYFLIVMFCVSVGEILLGKLVESTCQFRWWNYSKLPLNITEYTTIPTSAAFATLITFFMDKLFLPLYEYFMSWNANVLSIVASVLIVILMGDFLYSAYHMYKNKRLRIVWRIFRV